MIIRFSVMKGFSGICVRRGFVILLVSVMVLLVDLVIFDIIEKRS